MNAARRACVFPVTKSLPITPGHKCKPFSHLLLISNEHLETSGVFDPTISDEALAEHLQALEMEARSTISFHALTGAYSVATLCFWGHIQGSPVQVLLDGASTHNFVQTRVAKFLQLPVESTYSFSVVVGRGQRLRCGYCSICSSDHSRP